MTDEIPKLTDDQEQAVVDRVIGRQARMKATKFWSLLLGIPGLGLGGFFGINQISKPHHEHHQQIQETDTSSFSGLAALIISLKNDLNGVAESVTEMEDGEKKILENQKKFAALIDSTPTGQKIKQEYLKTHPRPFLGYNN